jgi:hypothetical protein
MTGAERITRVFSPSGDQSGTTISVDTAAFIAGKPFGAPAGSAQG